MSDLDLLWRWIEDPAALGDAELAELERALAADPALAARARRHLHLAARLGALAAPVRATPAPGADRTARPRRPLPRRRAHRARWLELTGAVTLAVTALLVFVLPRLRPGEPVVGRLADGRPVRVGQLVAAGGADAELRLEGGDRVVLAAGGELRVARAGAGAVRLDLVVGAATAEVAPRAAADFAIATPHATATVLGTRFTVRTGTDSSELAVERGRVAWASPTGRIEVGAGRRATIAAGGKPALVPLVRRWSFDDRARPSVIVAGIVADDPGQGPCLRGEVYDAGTNSLGMLASDVGGLTRIDASAVLSFRYRLDHADDASLFVWVQTADQAEWRMRIEPDPAPGWHPCSVRLADLEAIDDPARHPPDGALVLHLAIGVNDGVGRAIHLDDIEMREP